MSMDEPGLSGVPRFLEELLYPGHTASFFGLFYAVAYKDMEVPLFIKRRIPADGRVPAFPDTLQRPGGCPEEMQHWLITARGKCKVTYYGSDTKLIGAEHNLHYRLFPCPRYVLHSCMEVYAVLSVLGSYLLFLALNLRLFLRFVHKCYAVALL